ncbi:MAG: hypothetical protein AB7V13_00150 [Pseudorhodoplanes sp.]
MPVDRLSAERFSFVERPIPVPGDLRLSWRIPIVLLMLHHSRQNKASLVKLHVLNDAVRTPTGAERLRQIVRDQLPPVFWQPRIEPAFARAIDFANGDGFVTWVSTTNGSGLSLTDKSGPVLSKLIEMTDVLADEKQVILELAGKVTEGFAKSLLASSRVA